ncbi:MAG: NAD-dependent deacylase [Methylovulum sp.]|nr:NAD-dependent deacylase [Methylovulum sp.]
MILDDALLATLLNAKHIVVFTGAGMSAESGIATFRDAGTGLWEQYDPSVLASSQGYRADKALVWGWYEWRRMRVLRAEPNAGHIAVAELTKRVDQLTLITQNVDDLHERSGNTSVIHLHGSLHSPRCFTCARPYTFPDGIPNEPVGGRRLEPPQCNHCKGTIRPGVVWFGEMLSEAAWKQAEQATLTCDVFFSIGTSSLVWPAAQLPVMASANGAKVIQVNPGATALDNKAHYNLRGKAGEVMPALLDALIAH